jgi:UDP-N-acetylmuramoyl-L-alanyl-D-glutamate--2,6-diaminopimelate ligase
MPTISLSVLLADITFVPKQYDRHISDLALDSRKVKAGDLFFACVGTQTDGRKYINQAIENGAIAVVCEGEEKVPPIKEYEHCGRKVPLVSISDLNDKVAIIAARFFGEPAKNLFLIGITGTTGKTSTCHFIASCLEMAGEPAGIIGTLGNGRPGHLENPTHTTPDPIELQRMLAKFVAAGIKKVVMEVSSHGLDQKRVKGLNFTIAIFTNLSRDHLDYHKTMDSYANAKRQLFLYPNLQYAVINSDDEFGRQLITEFRDQLKVYAYSASGRFLDNHLPQIRVQQANVERSGLTASIHTPWGDGVLHSQLLGRFNISNLLAVLTTIGILGIPLKTALSYLAKLQGVPGRMELYGGGDKPLVVVDFAHTPEALLQVLLTVREYCDGELWCVFGCGGDRDKGKRPQMGAIAESHADHVIITDDNPRTEKSLAIISDILQGMHKSDAAVIEHDRHRAISHAIQCAHKDDVVLIAGRGGEQFQIIGTEKQPINDSVVVQMILTELSSE